MEILLCGLIVFPFFAALACFVIPTPRMRSFIVLFSGIVLVICALLQIPKVPSSISQQSMLGIDIHGVLQIADFLLLLLILYFGIRHRHLVIQLLAVLQILFLGYLNFFMTEPYSPGPIFYCDYLSLIMVLIVCVVGAIICAQAIAHMQKHEAELNLGVSRQPLFFSIMLVFLGAMNGIDGVVMALAKFDRLSRHNSSEAIHTLAGESHA